MREMATKYVVDTHALVWFAEGNSRLGADAKAILEDPESELIIPVIVLAEACWIIERGRTSIPSVQALMAVVDADPRIVTVPLSRSVLEKTFDLTMIDEMHDRQILATASLLTASGEDVALLTNDAMIRESGLVRIIW